jgi:hypothetical protein
VILADAAVVFAVRVDALPEVRVRAHGLLELVRRRVELRDERRRQVEVRGPDVRLELVGLRRAGDDARGALGQGPGDGEVRERDARRRGDGAELLERRRQEGLVARLAVARLVAGAGEVARPRAVRGMSAMVGNAPVSTPCKSGE